MKIGPVPPNRPEQRGDPKIARSNIVIEKREQTKDRVEVSQDAREKLAQMADESRRRLLSRTSEPDVPAQSNDFAGGERINRLRDRVQSGYYSRPDVMRRIADNLADDIKP